MHVICFVGPDSPAESVLFKGFYHVAVRFDGVGIFARFVKTAGQGCTVAVADHGIFIGIDIDGKSFTVLGIGIITPPGISAQAVDGEFLLAVVDFFEYLLYG